MSEPTERKDTTHLQATGEFHSSGDFTSEESAPIARTDVQIPGYEILEELGRGGMGVVYKARHLALNRIVALKMILIRAHAHEKDRKRFQAEAEAVAQLQHPNIIQIFEIGEHEDLPFFSLELCPGGSLGDRLDGKPLKEKTAASIIRVLASAIQTAHEKGIVHRDLKPANILIAEENLKLSRLQNYLKISDFGLAKRLDNEQSHTGSVLGTPSYMAPEQASAGAAGPMVDIYALGAILYELLTGRPPFRSSDPTATILQLMSSEPIPLRRLQSDLSRDLETICLKCLEKDPQKRYASADELRKDLDRFLDDEPIKARPISRWERTVRWVKRHPAMAILTLLTILVTLAGMGLVTWQWLEAKAAQQGEAEQRKLAERSLREARMNLYISRIALARQEWRSGNLSQVQALLRACPEELREWEWHYLNRLARSDLFTFRGTSGLNQFQNVACSPDGRYLAFTVDKDQVEIRDLSTGERVTRLSGVDRFLSVVAFSADGRYLAAGGQHIEGKKSARYAVWDWKKKTMILDRELKGTVVSALKFSPNGKWMLTASTNLKANEFQGGEVELWDWPNRKLNHSSPIPSGWVNEVAFSPNGDMVAAAVMGYSQRTGFVGVWSLPKVEKGKPFHGHIRGIDALAFSPDGRRLVTGSMDKTVIIWDVEKRKILHTLKGHEGMVTGVEYSPDGAMIASSSTDRTIRLWDAETGAPLRTLRGHRATVLDLTFHPSMRSIISLSPIKLPGTEIEIRAQDITQEAQVETWNPGRGVFLDVALHPTKSRLAIAGFSPLVREMDSSHAQTSAWQTPPQLLNLVRYSRDGKFSVTRGAQDHLVVRDEQGNETAMLQAEPTHLRGLRISPNGQYILADYGNPFTENEGIVQLWDRQKKKLIHRLNGRGIAFHPDGSRFAIGTLQGDILISKLGTEDVLQRIKAHQKTVTCLRFGPTGRWLVSGSADETLKLWDLKTGEHRTLSGHAGWIRQISFSPNGRRLASASLDFLQMGRGEVKLWDVPSGKEVLTLDGNASVEFSRDGRYLASLKTDFFVTESAKVWDGGVIQKLSQQERRDRVRHYAPTWHEEQASSAAEEERWFAALFHYQQRIEFKNASRGVWFRAALLALKLDDEAGYRRLCEQAKQVESEKILLAWMAKLRPGAMKSYDQAITRAREAVKESPKRAFYHSSLGGVLYRAGKYSEALKTLQESHRLHPPRLRFWDWLWLAMTHAKLGEKKQAQEWIEKYQTWKKAKPTLTWEADLELDLLYQEALKETSSKP